MNTFAAYMSCDHKVCDEAFARAEEAVLGSHWEPGLIAFDTFSKQMARHFVMEEDVLFPALIDAGGPAGPVQVMRMEHAQMNELISQMAAAAEIRDAQEYGGLSETLLIVMQQHNLKEEQILYPICDRMLATERIAVLNRLKLV